MCRTSFSIHLHFAGSFRLQQWLVAAQAAALALLFCPGIGAAQTPKGLIAVKQYAGCEVFELMPPCPSSELDPKAADNPAIQGLMIRVNWSLMYEFPTTIVNWSIIDAVFDQAKRNKKFVVLSFVPGFGTPGWAMNEITDKDMFCIPYGRVPFGPKAGNLALLPIPWNATYQSLWSGLPNPSPTSFIAQVAQRYAANAQFKMISADGPTSISEEMSMPGAESSGNGHDHCTKKQIDHDLTSWETTWKYTPSQYVNAWSTAFSNFAALFPAQYVSLALYPGLPIGPSSTFDATQKQSTPQDVIAQGQGLLGGMFAVEGNGLTPKSPGSPNYNLVVSNVGKSVTGFEFASPVTPNAANPAEALCQSLQTGLASNVDFLEIYESDAASSAPGVQSLLQSASSQLLLSPGTPRPGLKCITPPLPRPHCGPGSTGNTCM